MYEPLVTVIITTYNRRDLLPYAIKSVLNQTYKNYEIIVVNDHGEDIWDIIESFKSDKIKYLSHIKNSGLPYARNTAMKIAKGEIFCYLDDDDLFLSEHLETIVDAFKSPEVKMAYVDSYFVEEDLIDDQRIELKRSQRYSNIPYSFSRLLLGNFIPVNTWVHHSSLIEDAGYFDESLRVFEDWDMLIRLARLTDVVHIHKTTAEVRHRKHSGDNMLFRESNNKYYYMKKIYHRYPSDNLDIRKRQQMILYKRVSTLIELPRIYKIYFMRLHKLKYYIYRLMEEFILMKKNMGK